MLTLPHPASRLLLRSAALGLLAPFFVVLTGCQSIANAGATSQVRVIDVSPDAPALDIVPTSTSQPAPAALYNVGFGAVSSYMQLAPGAWTHSAYTAGTQQQIAQVRSSLVPGAQYTILTGNISAALQMSILRDQSTPAPPGLVALRFLGASTRSALVDLYLIPSGSNGPSPGFAPVAANLSFGSNTGYRNLPAGAYSLVALPAGASPYATPLFTGSQTTYPAGAARTILLIDAPFARASANLTEQPASSSGVSSDASDAPALQVITAADYDAPAS